MFFVSLLLNQTLGWMRTQSGTTSLRAILYMDEIFGYFPPVANPPSKLPLLTLLKQGRAFGLGVVLATQNPVDLDYKGLSNTVTWFIGLLQSENDKNRVLEGLEGVAAGSDLKFDRQQMEETLAGLSSRIFLLNNVHDDGPEVFESRWAMSYLRGPLTRSQIKTLMDPIKQQAATSPGATTAAPATTSASSTAPAKPASQTRQPVLPPDLSQYFIPVRSRQDKATLVYHPQLIGAAEVRFSDKRIDAARSLTLLAPIADGAVSVDWDQATTVDLPVSDLENNPQPDAQFAELPAAGGKAKNYAAWQKDLAGWLYRTQKLDLLSSDRLKQTSNPDESEQDFRLRLQQAGREQRDAAVEKLRQKYAPKVAALEERKRRAEQAVEREAEQSKSQKFQTAISFGATVLSSFLGRKSVSLTTLGRATTAARGVSRSMKEAQDVGRAQETVAAVDEQLAELEAQFKSDTAALEQSTDLQTEALQTLTLKPTKANIAIKHFSLAWAPFWHDEQGQATPAWQ
jgi:hypothetical protein